MTGSNRLRTAIGGLLAVTMVACDVGSSATPTPAVGSSPSVTVTPPALVLKTYESTIYAYTIGYPKLWGSTHEATRELVGAEPPWLESDAVDYVSGETGRTGGTVIVAAAEVPAATTLDSWFTDAVEPTCGSSDAQEPVEIDGEPGLLSTYPSCFALFHLWAIVVHGESAFHVVWLNTPGSEARDRGVFDQILASFRFMN